MSYETYAKVFAEENFTISPSDLLDRLSGLSLADMVATLEKTEGKSFSSAIQEKIHKAVLESFTRSLQPIPGTKELLEELVARNIPICIVSNGLRSRVDHALAVTGLKTYFPDNHIFDVSLVKNGKPAPDLLLYAAAQMGVSPDQCIVIDDSVTGISAAQAAQMTVVGFLGGSHCAQDGYTTCVIKTNPDAVVYSMSELGDLLMF